MWSDCKSDQERVCERDFLHEVKRMTKKIEIVVLYLQRLT